MLSDTSPIIAIATAPGRGGIGVIRISGSSLKTLVNLLCGQALQPRHATYLPFLDEDRSVIDRGLALYFPAPNSYTGEDVIELQAHGGPAVLQLLLRRCLQAGQTMGLRLAQPGEFTRRAFLNDKLDLAQAEAVADLIEATTEAAARSAVRSMEGVFSSAVTQLVDAVTHLRMLVEATLDFPEEEIDFLQASDALGQLAQIAHRLQSLLLQAKQGALLREGLHVVIAGQPNVGKSSLLNALAGAELAIVTPIAGTTRDKIVQTIQIQGIPLHIIDTAGLRDTHDAVEQIGIERSWQEIKKADLLLHLMDAQQGFTKIDEGIASQLPPSTPVLKVFNKIDLLSQAAQRVTDTVHLSAKEGLGIELLREALLEMAGWQAGHENLFIARERHLMALYRAQEHLQLAAQHGQQQATALDLFAEELRLAQESLGEITGQFSADDLLGRIFTQFCIGK